MAKRSGWRVIATNLNSEQLRVISKKQKIDVANYDNAFLHENGSILFTLLTQFRYGRFRGNELRDVYKIDPSYIYWSLKNNSHFAIEPGALLTLCKQKVFKPNQLNHLVTVNSDQEATLNLQEFDRDSDGFLFSRLYLEEESILGFNSSEVVEINFEKIKSGINFHGYQFGVPFDTTTTEIVPSKSDHIIFKLPNKPVNNKV